MNKSGVTKVSAITPKGILFCTEPMMSVGALIGNTGLVADSDGNKILLAGTPMAGDLTARGTAFVKAATVDTSVKGVYAVQITTAATADDVITIEGVNYTAGVAENIENKIFAVGANAEAQVTSLLKMVVCDDFVVAADTAADKIKFTQKIAATGDVPVASATKGGSGTLVIGNVAVATKAVEGTSASNAVGVLLHEIDVTAGDQNGTILVSGYVDLNKLTTETAALITAEVKTALKGNVNFLK